MSKEWNGSAVWAEFVKTAADTGLVTSDLTPDQEHVKDRQKDVPTGDDYTRAEKTKDYGVTDGSGKDLIEQAHPEDAQVASAMGKGGLVENQVQQQEITVDVATKMPDGALHGAHASVIQDLVKLANTLEDSGEIDAARRVDASIKEIRNLPFVNGHLCKEALLPAIPLIAYPIIAGVTALFGQANWNIFSSMREGLKPDINDLVEVLEKASDESPSAQKALSVIRPYAFKISSLSFSNEKDVLKFKKVVNELDSALPKLAAAIAAIELERGESRWFHFGMDLVARVNSKYQDFVKSYATAKKKITVIENAGIKAIQKQQTGSPATGISGINGLQAILFTRGYRGKKWDGKVTGSMDPITLNAAKELEMKLSVDLKNVLTEMGKKSDFQGKIVSNGQMVINSATLAQLVQLAEKVTR